MEDKSLFNSSQPRTISEGLQNFIDAMVEEIVLEGKPFDTQKKYLKKFSENEGLDYDKLEADITTFIEILDSLRVAFTKVQVKLAEEKGRECHISDGTVKKLVSHSLPSNPHSDGKKKVWPWIVAAGVGLIVVIALLSKSKTELVPANPHQKVEYTTNSLFIEAFWGLIHQRSVVFDNYDSLCAAYKGNVNGEEYDYLRFVILRDSRSFNDWINKLEMISDRDLQSITTVSELKSKLN